MNAATLFCIGLAQDIVESEQYSESEIEDLGMDTNNLCKHVLFNFRQAFNSENESAGWFADNLETEIDWVAVADAFHEAVLG